MIKKINNISKKIIQQSKSEKTINIYDNMTVASKATGISITSIANCLSGLSKTAGGFIWKYKEGPIPYQIEVPSFDYVDTTPVKMLDINGNLIKEFPSIVAAAKYMNTSTSNILHCLRGDTESSCGYIWRYKKYSKTPLAEEIFNRSLPDTIFLSKVRVLQYDLDGKFIKEYESMASASEATGINHSHIAQCTYGDRDRAGDYMWKTKEDENFPLQIAPYKEKPRRSRPILQYDKHGNFVREFQTIEEILNIYNVSRGTIMKCLSDSKKSFAGYVWRDKEENIPQTIDVSDIVFDSKWNVPVQKFDLEGNLIQEYSSIFAASKACGVSRTYIKNSIEGHSRKIDNCVWKYAQ